MINFEQDQQDAMSKTENIQSLADQVSMLEGLHKTEADLIINIKDKRLNQVYKGLTEAVVKEAFNWNDDFMKKA